MITVTIGGMTIPVEQVSEGWINQMISESRRRHTSLCIQVSVQVASAQMTLSTPGCGGGVGGSRPPNPTEQRIFDAWKRKGLHNGDFNPGDFRSFLSELARLT